ncbi:hypothetical protein DZF79_29075 [Vibrio parahaemolyticus]|nr:hypothetical protein [Vibrio parahaemolyticus]
MSKSLTPLTIGQLKERIKAFTSFEQCDSDMQDAINEHIKRICKSAKTSYADKAPDEEPSKAYEVSVDTMLADQSYTFDAFLYDNNLNIAFGDVGSRHVFLRAELLCLYLIKNKMVTAEQVDELRFGTTSDPLETLADLYTSLHLGFFESSAWGGRRVNCAEDYPFMQKGHLAIKNVANLHLIKYSKQQAQTDLQKYLEESRV